MAKVNFTARRVDEFACPAGKSQAFFWDAKSPGLGLRATASGAKSYIFQGTIHDRTLRLTIGDVKSWGIDAAQDEARRLQTLVNGGIDPREQRVEQRAAHEARKLEARRQTATISEAWAIYLEARRPKWSVLHYRDHVDLSSLGGAPKRRGKGLTEPGPLAALMRLKMADLNAGLISDWLESEAAKRPARARLAFNLLRIFASWLESKPEYRGLVDPQAISTRISKDALPTSAAKTDVIQREQLRGWFNAINQLDNPTMETYLIGLLLTGARREELAGLRWDDVDFRWRAMHLADKVEKEAGRVIPLTPYLHSRLLKLKQLNETQPSVRQLRKLESNGKTWKPSEWVFSSSSAAEGRLAAPNRALHRVCEAAGIAPVTPHGLRRSFSSLSEWVEVPTGVVAQIMGHRPSATAERHYKIRPIDLLRMWHDKIEGWVLEQAGIEFVQNQEKLGFSVANVA